MQTQQTIPPPINCRHFDRRKEDGLRVCNLNVIDSPTRAICNICKHRERNRVGLGDVVEWIIKKLSFGSAKPVAKKVAKAAGKQDCGCQKRRAALNRIGGN